MTEVCPICGSKNTRFYYANSYINNPVYYLRYALCKDCDCAWHIPRMTKLDYMDFVSKVPFKSGDPVKETCFGIVQSIENARVENSLEKSVLEIGCGTSYVLKIFKESGWTVFGTEASLENYKSAIYVYGLKHEEIYNGLIEDIQSKFVNQFDNVLMLESLESSFNPIAVLNIVAKALKPKGLLWLQSRFIEDVHLPFTSDEWEGTYFKPQNLTIFSWKQISKILKDLGFETKTLNPTLIQAKKGG